MGRWRLFSSLVLALASSRVLSAQTTGGIQGIVTNISGSLMPGVTVEATSLNLQGSRTAISGPDGFYRIPAVPPGEYRVLASLPGFHTAERAATVRLASTATADFALEPTTSAQVVVTGSAPLIDTTSTATGTTYTSNVIARLPVARNYGDIVMANPGVSMDVGATEGRFLPLAISGATSAENQWIIDGVNTNYVSTGIQGKAINNEFVQEVSVITGGYSVEYGRALGGIVNAVTRSGGNQFHGDGYVYYDSLATGADVQFKPGDANFPTTRVMSSEHFDYGIGLGGFLVTDRLWFFAAYNRITNQSELSPLDGTQVSPDRYPLDEAGNFYSGKLTWNASQGTTVVGTVFADPSNQSGLASGAVPFYSTLDPSTWWSFRTQGGADFGARLTQLFGARAIASLQGSYHQDQNSRNAADGIKYFQLTCEGGTPEQRCAFPEWFNNIWGGYGNLFGGASSRSQLAASGTYYAGNHELRAGGDYMDGRTKGTSYTTGGQQVFIYNQWGQLYYEHRFVTHDPDALVPVAKRFARAQVIDYSVFAQDSWKVMANLTVNLGLRWDGEQVRDYAGQTVLRFNEQWQPRVGVVWDPWKDGATRVYASAGRFSYGVSTSLASASFGSFPYFVRTYNFDPVDVTPDPNVFHQPKPRINGGSPFGDPVDAGVKPWSQDELTAGIERMILPTLSVGLQGAYRSLHSALEDRCDFDYTAPEMNGSSCALINPGSSGMYASGRTTTCNGYYSNDYPDAYQCYPQGPATPAPKRSFRSIGLLARETMGDRLWLQASYVYSSLRGNYDGAVNEGVFQQFSGQTLPGFDYDFNYPAMWHNAYGTLSLDRPNHFRLDGYWVTPWQLSLGLQTFAESGAPQNKMGYFSDEYGSMIILEPRGSQERLPTLWGANLTISYPIAIGPVTVTLQAYLYNVFNKQIATSTDQSWTVSPPAGYPASIYDPGQPQNNPAYGSVTSRSAPRLFRAAAKVSF